MTTSQMIEFFSSHVRPDIENLQGFSKELDSTLAAQDNAIINAISLNAFNLAVIEAQILLDKVKDYEIQDDGTNLKFRFNKMKNELIHSLEFFIHP